MDPILVLGIGNEYRRDDAAGLWVARRLRLLDLPGVTVVECSGEVMDLLEYWQSAAHVLLIDAAVAGATPGTWRRWQVGRHPLPTDLSAASTHALSVVQAIELARVLDCLPQRLILYGIEGVDFAHGVGLSPAVTQTVPILVQRIVRELNPTADCLPYGSG